MPDEALDSYYDLCRSLVKAGWTLNDIEDADFETLMDVVHGDKRPERIDLMDYMLQEKGLA